MAPAEPEPLRSDRPSPDSTTPYSSGGAVAPSTGAVARSTGAPEVCDRPDITSTAQGGAKPTTTPITSDESDTKHTDRTQVSKTQSSDDTLSVAPKDVTKLE